MQRWSVIYKQLKNRRVIRTGVIYLAFLWGSVELADLLVGADMINENLVRWLLLGGVLGFPAVLALSWFFESPWRQRRWFSVLGDVGVIVTIAVATLLFAREQLFPTFARPVVAVIRIEPTDTRADTPDLATHLSDRIRMLLATSAEIRVIELTSSRSSALAGLSITEKASALHADLLIGGTVNQGQDEVRLNLQLFAADGELLWSDRFNDRLIDQAQLQNRVLNNIWPYLPLSEQVLEDLREMVVNCEYPADPNAIRAIISAGAAGSDTPIETMNVLIEQNRDNGLLHLARAKQYFRAIDSAPATSKSVFQNMAMRDLEQAAIECPGHPVIQSERVYHTLQLQGQENTRRRLLAQFPNEARLRLQLAAIYEQSGDIADAIALAAEARTLNPLDTGTVCFHRQLLQAQDPVSGSGIGQPVESGTSLDSSIECP